MEHFVEELARFGFGFLGLVATFVNNFVRHGRGFLLGELTFLNVFIERLQNFVLGHDSQTYASQHSFLNEFYHNVLKLRHSLRKYKCSYLV